MTNRVDQISTLELGVGDANARVSQVATLVLAQNVTPTRVDQIATLVLGRVWLRRVMSQADVGNVS